MSKWLHAETTKNCQGFQPTTTKSTANQDKACIEWEHGRRCTTMTISREIKRKERWGQIGNLVEIHAGYSRLFTKQRLFSKYKTTLMFKNMNVNLQHAEALSFLLALRQAELQNSFKSFCSKSRGINFTNSVVMVQDLLGRKINKFETCLLKSKFVRNNHAETILCPGSSNTRLTVKTALVAYVYLFDDSRCPSPTQELRGPFSYVESSGHDFLTRCDVSLQYIFWWNSNCKTDQWEGKLFDFITSANVMVASIECAATLVELRRSEIIDITICTSKALKLIRNW